MTLPVAGGRFAPPLVSAVVRGLATTWRVRWHRRDLLETALEGGAVVGFWHGQLLPMVALHRGLGLSGLTSNSRDGELAARVIAGLGYGVLRGSTSRGGVGSLRSALRLLRQGGSPALALDGPRGPRHEPHVGVLGLAAYSGRPVVFGVGRIEPSLRLRSWDRFEIPPPACRVEVAYGLLAPPAPDRPSIEAARATLGAEMERLEAGLRESRLSFDETVSSGR